MISIHSDYDGLDARIDATEVTGAAYAAFLAVYYDSALQPPECAWNSTFVPAGPTLGDDYPVTYVDWCDAAAYCAWAGKRLCGLFGGAAADLVDDEAEINLYDEWYNACTGAHPGTDSRGHQKFPYGDAFDASACNVLIDGVAAALAPTGSKSACEGGYPGLFDMSGNAAEWSAACDGTDGAGDLCRKRGGSVKAGAIYVRCESIHHQERSTTQAHTGFRCCAD
jgi:sulfatase modifying factor 1